MKYVYATIGAAIAAPIIFLGACIAAAILLYRTDPVDAAAFNYIKWADEWDVEWDEDEDDE